MSALSSDSNAWSALTPRQRTKYRHLTSWWFAPAYFLFAFVVRAGFLDGRAGLAYAFMKFAYFSEVRLKIRELKSTHGG